MKKFAAFMVVAMAVVFAFGTAFANPDKIVIKEFQKTKGAVSFDHKAHQAKVKVCKDCHHKNEAGKEEKCSKCHGAKTEGKKLEAKESFHKQCKGCHQKEKKGPTKCDECHAKK
jgi:uncharacterized paraquat-inducible protein A